MATIKKVIKTEGKYRNRHFAGKYSPRVAFVKLGSYWTYAEWNPAHANWIAGNAYARTPEDAVGYADYKSLPRRKSIASLIEDFLYYGQGRRKNQ